MSTVIKPEPVTMVRLIFTFLSQLLSPQPFSLVSVHCKDTRIAVQVRTNKPFNGRIYALGRSETCNIDVINSDLFRLDLTMGGQDCNTQSVVCYSNKIQFSISLNILVFFRPVYTPTQSSSNITTSS